MNRDGWWAEEAAHEGVSPRIDQTTEAKTTEFWERYSYFPFVAIGSGKSDPSFRGLLTLRETGFFDHGSG